MFKNTGLRNDPTISTLYVPHRIVYPIRYIDYITPTPYLLVTNTYTLNVDLSRIIELQK